MNAATPHTDPHVGRLARMFAEHPAWISAAKRLEPNATSAVYFSHRRGEVWHLERRHGTTWLTPGPASDPDFVFRFTPASIDRLVAVEGGIGDFAVELFTLITETRSDLRIGLRLVASFPRLVRRGYLGVLVAGGSRVLAFGASHGVRTVAQLRRLIDQLRNREPQDWERTAPPEESGELGQASRRS